MQTKAKQLICADIFKDQQVLVVGLGKTGLSCARFLHERQIDFAIMDSRAQPPALDDCRMRFPEIEIHLGRLSGDVIAKFDVLLVSPGISLKEPALQAAIKNGKSVIGDVEVFARCFDRSVIAITGSNGKSTVTTLVGEMARLANRNVAVAGNIGLPVLDALDEQSDADLFVLELSSFQLETTHHLNATVSTVLNISEDHMDRYASLEDYTQSKLGILQGNGVMVINLDDAYLNQHIADKKDRNCLYFTLGEPRDDSVFGVIQYQNNDWLARGSQPLLPISNLKISGRHNIANTLAALALGSACELPLPAMLEAIQRFTGLAHRTQWVAEHHGVHWFNDSKATNVGAAIAAINGMQNSNQILLLGGQGKGQDFSPLKAAVQQHAKAVILYGEDADAISRALENSVKQYRVATLEHAVRQAAELAVAGDIVLLSPACASFDMFSGYEQRGDTFMRLVEEVVV